jgi:hypothetical protein
MTVYQFTAPDGQKYRVKGPPGSTQEEAFSILQQQMGAEQPAAQVQPPAPQPQQPQPAMLPTAQDANMVGRRDTVFNRLRSGTSLTAPPQRSPTDSSVLPIGNFEARGAGWNDQLRLASGFLLNANPEARKDMVSYLLGSEAQFSQDSQGRDIVSYRGETAYLNKPGFDSRDAIQLAGEVVKFAPAAKFANFLRGIGGGAVTRALGGGAAAGVTQIGSDEAARIAGSEQGFDRTSALVAAGGGALGEVIGAGFNAWRPQAKQIMQDADRLGINLRGSPGEQVSQTVRRVDDMASSSRGEGMAAVRSGVQREREVARQSADDLFAQARNPEAGSAFIRQPQVRAFSSNARVNLAEQGFDVENLPKLGRRLEEIDSLANTEGASATKLNALEMWRRRVGKSKSADPEEAQALRVLKNQYDEWMTGQFNDDMVAGNKDAITAWKDARTAWAEFKQRFDDNKVIQDLARKETTVEQMRQWVFNANAVNASNEAGKVVAGLNRILGPKSPEMDALRREFIFDVAEPLMRPAPNIRAFLNNYEKAVRKNPTLVRELFPDEVGGIGDFGQLAAIARGIAKRPGAVEDRFPETMFDKLQKIFWRFSIGHGIAKGQARIGIATGITDWLRDRTVGTAARRNILWEALGHDPTMPMFRGATAYGAAAGVTREEENGN